MHLGPVYVITPVDELYASEPSPPESVTDINPLASESAYIVGSVYEITPVVELYDKSPPAEIELLAFAVVNFVTLNAPVVEL